MYALYLSYSPLGLLVEAGLALKAWQRWADLRHDGGLPAAYQTTAELLIGWLTAVFALAATYAAFRSAAASERQAEAANKQALAADKQASVATA